MSTTHRTSGQTRNWGIDTARSIRSKGVGTKEHDENKTVVPPVGQDHSLTSRVYAALLQAITDRRIRPGQHLRLDTLAAQFKVSRTPIRDALSQLVAEGVVQPFGGRGLCVTQLTPDELSHLYDLRLMCELYAVEKGFRDVTPSLITTLEKYAAEISRVSGSSNPNDRLARSLADREFHVALLGLARNPRLMRLYDQLNIHIHSIRVGPSALSSDQRLATNSKEHEDILAALRRRDLAAVKRTLRSHIINARARALESLELEKAN